LSRYLLLSYFSFTLPLPTVIYTLSLHDALPICDSDVLLHARAPWPAAASHQPAFGRGRICGVLLPHAAALLASGWRVCAGRLVRSEEHTSELQSRFDLVCRLLLEKKKKKRIKSK